MVVMKKTKLKWGKNMKKQFRKITAFLLTIALIGSFSLPAFADADFGSKTFPTKATPGATIICTEEGLVEKAEQKNTVFAMSEFLPGVAGLDLEYEEAIVRKVKQEAENLPEYFFGLPETVEAEPGMRAYYDGSGFLMKVIDADGKTVEMNNPLLREENNGENSPKASYYNQIGTFHWGTNNYNTLTRTSTTVLAEGWVTWFDDAIGDHGNTLTSTDCATNMNYDRPASNTQIHVRDTSTNIDTYLYKNDIGSLPNAILDIRPEVMRNVFHVATGANSGRFSGRYFYYR